MVLCNVSTANPSGRANRVADVVLKGRFTEPAPSASPGADPDARTLTEFAGTYWHEQRMQVVRISAKTRGAPRVPLRGGHAAAGGARARCR